MSLEARAVLWAVLVVSALAGWWRLTAHYEHVGYQRAQAEYQAAAESQREANRGRARAAEERYTPAAESRERFIVTTVKEIQHETDNLAACVLSPAAADRLRRAAACARGDSAASCGPGEPVRQPG